MDRTPGGSEPSSSSDCWSGLPPDVRARADVAGSGELLWPREAAKPAVDWLVEQALGIIGGEVYVGVGKAKGVFQAEWQTAPQWRADEPWQTFVLRAGAQAAESILGGEADTPAATTWYFLAVARESQYPQFLRDG
jgi:hypothetical protein